MRGSAIASTCRTAASHLVFGLALGLTTLLSCDVSAADRTLDDAVYSKAQARAGKKVYEQHCIACHKRSYFREVLRAREGESLATLFEVMVALMPQNAPGSLSDRDYVDIIAYIVSQARYGEGKKPLRTIDLPSITIPARN